ncbi:phage holin [Brevibacillus fulvus]|uniref:LL-H family phage holin n=1 Tax=Brevibacillus fulvus TaxID=1125967 RepID=A0A938XXX4_9BACL|nr:phage holin [Brevibacillus fulvus]MBM7592237.1 LL-H family phage holin [Brevibacillus fulvus]
MTFDMTKIVEALIALVAAVITAFVIPYIRSKTTEAQRSQIQAWVNIAVAAAEQIFNGNDRGAEKKRYVLDFLKSKGFTLDDAAIENLIEAAVFELSQKVVE